VKLVVFDRRLEGGRVTTHIEPGSRQDVETRKREAVREVFRDRGLKPPDYVHTCAIGEGRERTG
jgi:hypothetical protein